MRTAPNICASASVTGAKSTVVEPAGARSPVSVSTSRPSMSRATSRPVIAVVGPRLVSRAATWIRSRPEKYSRSKSTPATLTLAPVASSSPTGIGVSTVPCGNRTPTALSTPARWKSLISTASRRGRSELSKIPSASFRAGP